MARVGGDEPTSPGQVSMREVGIRATRCRVRSNLRRSLRSTRRADRSCQRPSRSQVHLANPARTARPAPRSPARHHRELGAIVSVVRDIFAALRHHRASQPGRAHRLARAPRVPARIRPRHSQRSDDFRRVDFRFRPHDLIRCWDARADHLPRPTPVPRVVRARMISNRPA